MSNTDLQTATVCGVAVRVRRLARIDMRRQRLVDELAERVEDVRTPFVRRIEALDARAARLLDEVEDYCRTGRDALFPGRRRSLKTSHGTVAFRRGTESLVRADGLTDADVCAALRAERLGRFIRKKESLDRPALRRALREGRLSAERAARCGVKVQPGKETFRCDLQAHSVRGELV